MAEHPSYSYDLYATVLYLLGLDHEKLRFYHNSIVHHLTDVHDHVIHGILEEIRITPFARDAACSPTSPIKAYFSTS